MKKTEALAKIETALSKASLPADLREKLTAAKTKLKRPEPETDAEGGRVLTTEEAQEAIKIIRTNLPKEKVPFFNNKRATMRMLKWGVGEKLCVKISKALKAAGLPHAVTVLYATYSAKKQLPNAIIIRVPLDFEVRGATGEGAKKGNSIEAQIARLEKNPVVKKYLALKAKLK